ncbi:hypothetical protein D9M69_712610 [compost metagenome]
MLYASRHDQEFVFFQFYSLVAKFHLELAADNHKHLVFVIVLVPDKFSLKLDQLDVLSVQLSDNSWIPIIVE